MTSPTTGKEMPILKRLRKFEVKGQKVYARVEMYYCRESNEHFTDSWLDNKNLEVINSRLKEKRC